jgi:hypothetical protein
MSAPLIGNISKVPHPNPPGEIIEGSSPVTAVVGGADSVPIEIHIEGLSYNGQVGVDIVFLIDNSGSMESSFGGSGNDPSNKRFEALRDLAGYFSAIRDALDRIAVILFQGEEAEIVQQWKTWSETRATAQTLYEDEDGSGATPMAHGMKLANDLLISSNGFFKLVVLLSDGEPTADAYTSNPIETILEELCPQAYYNRILYSTIYLTQSNPPEVHPLLWSIAKSTDYITNYISPADAPPYYFTVNDTNEIISSYRTLFEDVMGRIVPQNVVFREQVNNKLIIDPNAPITFSGDGFREDQNIIGYGPAAEAEGVSTLEEALERFRRTQDFEIHLNELLGEAILKFSVKLNLQAINIEDYPGDQICIDVDTGLGLQSSVGYIEPTGGTGSSPVLLPLPQARVCFRKGISVRKSVETNVDNTKITIDVCNLDLHPAEWVDIAECPSSFMNVCDIEDDFGFDAFQNLFSNIIHPWMFKTIWAWINRQDQYREKLESLTANERQSLKRRWRNKFTEAHETLLRQHRTLDQYLTRFSFVEIIPEEAGIAQYWQTVHQKGIYKIITNLPPLSQRRLRIDMVDASYSTDPGSVLLQRPVDAVETKAILPMSWYRRDGMLNPVRIVPNPIHSQIVGIQTRPDLFTSTCFMERDIRNIRGLFIGPRPANAWTMLDSIDIHAIWNPQVDKYGVSVTVNNVGGGQSVATKVNVKSYLILFTGEQEFPDATDLVFNPLPTAVASGSFTVGELAFRQRQDVSIYYDTFSFLNNIRTKINVENLHAVRNGLMINLVDITPPDGEVMTGNNQAIEIVRITGGRA